MGQVWLALQIQNHFIEKDNIEKWLTTLRHQKILMQKVKIRQEIKLNFHTLKKLSGGMRNALLNLYNLGKTISKRNTNFQKQPDKKQEVCWNSNKWTDEISNEKSPTCLNRL